VSKLFFTVDTSTGQKIFFYEDGTYHWLGTSDSERSFWSYHDGDMWFKHKGEDKWSCMRLSYQYTRIMDAYYKATTKALEQQLLGEHE
jgi:hypothetical protein